MFDNVASGRTFSILTKLLPSFIQKPDLNSILIEVLVAFVLSCWAFFSLFGVIKSPTANVRMLKKIAIGITALAICFIESPLDLKIINSD